MSTVCLTSRYWQKAFDGARAHIGRNLFLSFQFEKNIPGQNRTESRQTKIHACYFSQTDRSTFGSIFEPISFGFEQFVYIFFCKFSPFYLFRAMCYGSVCMSKLHQCFHKYFSFAIRLVVPWKKPGVENKPNPLASAL